jgi:hypothetical protein
MRSAADSAGTYASWPQPPQRRCCSEPGPPGPPYHTRPPLVRAFTCHLVIAGGPLRCHARALPPCALRYSLNTARCATSPTSPASTPGPYRRMSAAPNSSGPWLVLSSYSILHVNRPVLYPSTSQASQHATPTAANSSRRLVLHLAHQAVRPAPWPLRGARPTWPQYAGSSAGGSARPPPTASTRRPLRFAHATVSLHGWRRPLAPPPWPVVPYL